MCSHSIRANVGAECSVRGLSSATDSSVGPLRDEPLDRRLDRAN